MMTKCSNRIAFAATALLMIGSTTTALAQQLKGNVVDKNSHETLIGAVVTVEGTNLKAVTDIDGNFQLNGLKKGTYTLYINLLLSGKTQKSIKILPEVAYPNSGYYLEVL